MAMQPAMPRGHAEPGQDGGHALEVRLAATAQDIDAAQALRYRVFFDEMGASPSAAARRCRRDRDRFDGHCDHLLVIDHGSGGEVVGTYRLLRRTVAEHHGGFYTQTEFDITSLLAVDGELLELGRSCVDPAYRFRPAMHLLWRGIGEYCFRHGIKLMFGCASLPGSDIAALAPALSYLHHNHRAPPHLRARALPDRFIAMDILAPGDVDPEIARAQLAARAPVAALPPLIKGYLRLGGLVGDGAVIDRAFNTTDVCLIVPTDGVAERYFRHFMRTAPALASPTGQPGPSRARSARA